MPTSLRKPKAPTILLWLFAVVFGIVAGLARADGRLPSHAELIASWTWPLLLALWVEADARSRHRQLCYDFDSFVFFGWWLVVPVYLFQTRGLRTFLTLLGLAGLCIVIWLSDLAAFLWMSSGR